MVPGRAHRAEGATRVAIEHRIHRVFVLRNKAIVGVIANVLRPGKAVQVSLQDNRWLRDPECLQLPKVSALLNFVDAVIGVTSPTSPTAPAGP